MKISRNRLRQIIQEELAEAQKPDEDEVAPDPPLEEDDEPEATDPWRDDTRSGSPSSGRRPRRGSRHTHQPSGAGRDRRDWTDRGGPDSRTWGESHERLVSELGIDRLERQQSSGPWSQNLTATAPTKRDSTAIAITSDDLVVKVGFGISYTLHLDAGSAAALGQAILEAGEHLQSSESGADTEEQPPSTWELPGI